VGVVGELVIEECTLETDKDTGALQELTPKLIETQRSEEAARAKCGAPELVANAPINTIRLTITVVKSEKVDKKKGKKDAKGVSLKKKK
jgi:hypothetical protein